MIQKFTPREAYAKYMMGAVLVDVSDIKEPRPHVHVNHLYQLPLSEIENRWQELPTNRTLMLVSQVGIKSREAAQFLMGRGFADVGTVDGGVQEWEEEGLPVAS